MHRCGCTVYTKPNIIHLLKGTLPVWRGSYYSPLLSRSFNTTREAVLGDQPAVTDSWACCRFLFLNLLSIIFKALSPTPLQVRSITAMGEHQGAAARPIAFQTVMATGCTKVRKSLSRWQRSQIQIRILNLPKISKQPNFSVLFQYLQKSQSELFVMTHKIHFEMSSHFWPK